MAARVWSLSKDGTERTTVRVDMRLDQDSYTFFSAMAERLGISLSDLVRACALDGLKLWADGAEPLNRFNENWERVPK